MWRYAKDDLRRLDIYLTRVRKQLEVLETEVGTMGNVCNNMKDKLDQARDQTAEMIEQAHNLQDRR